MPKRSRKIAGIDGRHRSIESARLLLKVWGMQLV
jgi:hypothetical protein